MSQALPGWTRNGARLEKESKHSLPLSRAGMATRLIQGRCQPDPEFPGGFVSSLYFDTADWLFLSEKRNSDYLKTKVRLRWYGPSGFSNGRPARSGPVFAEAKLRVGSKRTKVRIPIEMSAEEMEDIDLSDRRLLGIPTLLASAGIPIRRGIHPAFVIRYHRRRFIERRSGARLSIDRDITVPRVNPRLIGAAPNCALPDAVIENKWSGEGLPPALTLLRPLGLRKASFSKYLECYARLTGTVF